MFWLYLFTNRDTAVSRDTRILKKEFGLKIEKHQCEFVCTYSIDIQHH